MLVATKYLNLKNPKWESVFSIQLLQKGVVRQPDKKSK